MRVIFSFTVFSLKVFAAKHQFLIAILMSIKNNKVYFTVSIVADAENLKNNKISQKMTKTAAGA